MTPANELTVSKWPFFMANGIFVAAGAVIRWTAAEPLGPGAILAIVLLFIVGACLSLLPYLLEFYWKWQFAQTEQEEEAEQQRLAFAQATEKFSQMLKRWEGLTANVNQGGGDSVSLEGMQTISRQLEQMQVRFDERDETLTAALAACQDAMRESRDSSGESRDASSSEVEEWSGPGSDPAPVDETEVEDIAEETEEAAEEEDRPDSLVAGDGLGMATPPAEANGDRSGEEKQAVAVPRPRKPRKPQVREEEGASLFSTTTVVATAYIGASNKLYLRGEGAGLSWDEGIPMRFVEIGKWSWTTTDATGPIRIQVFKNDEEEDKAGILTLEPGQRLDIRPDFGG